MLHLNFNPDPILFNYLLIFFNNIPRIFKTILKRSSLSQLAKPTFPFKSLKFLQPPKFKGTIDPYEAKIWLREIEKNFEIIGAEEDKKVIFYDYMLTYWWEAKKILV